MAGLLALGLPGRLAALLRLLRGAGLAALGHPLRRLHRALAAVEVLQEIDLLVCHTLFLNERPPDLMHQIGWNWIQFSSCESKHIGRASNK